MFPALYVILFYMTIQTTAFNVNSFVKGSLHTKISPKKYCPLHPSSLVLRLKASDSEAIAEGKLVELSNALIVSPDEGSTKIAKLEVDIEAVVKKIEIIEENINIAQKANDRKVVDYLRKKELQLRRKEEQLRDIEAQVLKMKFRASIDGPDIFMRPDTILTYLQDRGFIPDEILPAMNLVEIGDQSRGKCLLLNRDDAINNFRDISNSRLLKRRETDKEAHPHVICISAPGTGKSRLADYGLEALKSSDINAYPKLAELANNGAALAVHVSYNGHSPFNTHDIKLGPSASLACRLLDSYFRSLDRGSFLQQLLEAKYIESLTVGASLQAILSHHRSRLSLPAEQDLLLYIAVDDVSGICSFGTDWTLDKGKEYLKALFSILSGFYSDWHTHSFLVTMVTGTVLGPISEVLINRKYINLAVPLLSLSQSLQLAEDAFSRANVDKKDLASFDWLEFKLLLSDIGGIPRYVWEAINGVLKPNLQRVELSRIGESIQSSMIIRYGILSSSSLLYIPSIVSVALLRQPIDPNFRVLMNSADSTTWSDLENRGILYFLPSNKSETTIALPFYHFQTMIRNFPFSPSLKNLFIRDWTSWELFVVSHDALLLSLYRLQRTKYVSVAEYYKGAIVGESAKDIILCIPEAASDFECNVVTGDAFRRFPESKGSSLSVSDARVVFVNSPGVKLDIIIPHQKYGSKDQEAILYRGIHCKYTAAGKTMFNPFIHINISKYTTEGLSQHVSPSSNFLHVYISNRFMKHDSTFSSGILKRTKTEDRVKIPSDAVFVTRDQLEGFFSRTFADRISLILEAIEQKGLVKASNSRRRLPSIQNGVVSISKRTPDASRNSTIRRKKHK